MHAADVTDITPRPICSCAESIVFDCRKYCVQTQGTGQKAGGLVANYGDGLATDPHVLSAFPTPLSDPNPFFVQLLKRPYLNQVDPLC